MAEYNDKKQFGAQQKETAGMTCARCEGMIADALDGTLSVEEQAAFDLHLMHCQGCTERLAEAKRGQAWLATLKQYAPVPSDDLVAKILAKTSGAINPVVAGSTASMQGNVIPFRTPEGWGARAAHLRRVAMHPRLAMTAAMAFVSITLTLNLVGVHVTRLAMSDLKPSNIRRNFYQANAHAIRYYDNLKVVYELQSRVQDLKREESAPQPEQKKLTDDDKKGPKPSGSSRKEQAHKPMVNALLDKGVTLFEKGARKTEVSA